MTINQAEKLIQDNIKLSHQELIKLLNSKGFLSLNTHRNNVLIRRNIVIKVNNVICSRRLKRHMNSFVETRIVRNVGKGGNRVVVQFKCRTDAKSVKKAMNIFKDSEELDRYDIHKGNVGVYKNKPVIFDW